MRVKPKKEQKSIRIYSDEIKYLVKKFGSLQKALDMILFSYLEKEGFYQKRAEKGI